jgi:hypothetical protein
MPGQIAFTNSNHYNDGVASARAETRLRGAF